MIFDLIKETVQKLFTISRKLMMLAKSDIFRCTALDCDRVGITFRGWGGYGAVFHWKIMKKIK